MNKLMILFFDGDHGWQECEMKEDEFTSLSDDEESDVETLN